MPHKDPEQRRAYHAAWQKSHPEKVAQYETRRREKERQAPGYTPSVRHGMFGTPTYNVWVGMLARCRNPHNAAYGNYGGRGIQVCDRWLSFVSFYADMGQKPAGMSIERRDNSRGYTPENCYWSTPAEQNNNRRTNVVISYNGQSLTISQWSKQLNIPRRVLDYRHHAQWPVEDIFTVPVRRTRRRQH